MRSKLVLVFSDISLIKDVPKVLVFDSISDAEHYLLSAGKVDKIEISPEDAHFSYWKTPYRGSGVAYWSKVPFLKTY